MNIEVCYTPQAYNLFHKDDSIVVVIDIFRATSAIVTAFYNGVSKMIPVATVAEAKEYQKNGYMAAAERDGEVIEGFELGNSPFGYMNSKVKGKTIAISTTNGTQAIEASRKASKILVGSFLNLDVLCEYLSAQKKDVILVCAGWKNKFNLEDTVFAGAVVEKLTTESGFEITCDSAIASKHLYNIAKVDLFEFLSNSSHRNRLAKLDLERDIKYCLTPNQCPVIPVMEGKYLVKM
ncbi:MAG: 2-phosphosulfolactate phosphatase [Bacteroidia bacterium]|jgi:2-phosphosulfolactate phosphatase|nr:2-phosphosulfolactate phosphatase [Bacteroidia bacterium]